MRCIDARCSGAVKFSAVITEEVMCMLALCKKEKALS